MKEYPILSRLSSYTGRAVVFFFATSSLLFFIFLVGNYQDFLDATQSMLLSALSGSLALELVCGIALAAFLGRRALIERRPFIVRWILLGCSLVISGGLLLGLHWLRSWLRT
jgi:hypothetical protein